MPELKDFITVDPGWNTGIAFWKNRSAFGFETDYRSVDRSIQGKEERLVYMWSEFKCSIRLHWKPRLVVIEQTDYRPTSLTSVVAHKQGDIHTLAMLIGGYCRVCAEERIPFMLIPSIRWKGNMNDAQVKRRIAYITGVTIKNSHVADAVGIGLSLMGQFNIRKQVKK